MKKIFTTRGAMWALVASLLSMYALLPLGIYTFVIENPYFLYCAALSSITCLGIILGQALPIFDHALDATSPKVLIPAELAIKLPLYVFLAFAVLTLVTADSIPIVSALLGADVNALSDERGAFLKGRQGGWIALLYLSSILTSTVLPYALTVAYASGSKLKSYIAVAAIVFSATFLVKALFLNFIFPILSLFSVQGRLNWRKVGLWLGISCLILWILVDLSGYGALDAGRDFNAVDYFSTAYIPSGPLDFIIYRALVVPVISVIDTLTVHDQFFSGQLLLGTTSSPIAAMLGTEKVNLERIVFEYQYGGWNELANSNVAFFVDGYVNFGWAGCLVFGVVVGQMYRSLEKCPDPAINALGLLLTFQLYSSPLIQMMLSNGWILVFLFVMLFRVDYRSRGKTFLAHA